jgi:hypothetical protein
MERLSGWELSIGRIKRILDETPGKPKASRPLFLLFIPEIDEMDYVLKNGP